ncbi:19007_t:CDS:2 [Racocetra fulgida]|uniref:19007_t:CDS:1 n=1 Tax=Racocetra fulgida TaxID=60492 RepID=A0A9N8ZR16_9GLOM|nr:19007_t:CDS:2 [Racocetra fulgida]
MRFDAVRLDNLDDLRKYFDQWDNHVMDMALELYQLHLHIFCAVM